MRNPENAEGNRHGARLTRRQFVQTGGALFVGVSVVGADFWAQPAEAATGTHSLDATAPGSWIEIHADNSILFRTGKADFGQTTATTSYTQIVAEELRVPFEAIVAVVMGDTDRTPDGGGTFGLLGGGTPNIRKVAAYTYQALLDLAASRLGVPKSELSVENGVVSGGGRRLSYGALIEGQELDLTIPVRGSLVSFFGLTVDGDPPMKPASEFTVIGKSYRNDLTEAKVTGKQVWATDVRLPGMLHARVVHPKTLGSTLIAAGELDKKRFPNAQVVVRGSLVGVVAPTEWEAVAAARQVASRTTWTEWKGLPGSRRLFDWMREDADWTKTPVSTSTDSQGDVVPVLASAAKKLSATYEFPSMKHAPMGPTMAVADVRADGTVFVYTSNQNAQALRDQMATMLNIPADAVVVRILAGPGHYGRSNGGSAGGEDEAVILSKALGRPVRVQWTREDDFMWSTQSAPALANVEVGLDAKGKIVAYQFDHYMPARRDNRPVGALLAGLPTMLPPSPEGVPGYPNSTLNATFDGWVYTKVDAFVERGHGTFQIGEHASPLAIGLRNHSLRTPGHFQHNFPRESALNDVAALAGVDPIQFRLDHTDNPRLRRVLETARDASGWRTRPSPGPTATTTGTSATRGQGVSVIYRGGSYWACVCQVSVVPETGKVLVETCTVVVDPGIVVNPMQLKRQIEGGTLMGISHALHEEVSFDEGQVTSRDWRSYPILTMAEAPEMKVVILNNPEVGTFGQGSEAANAVAAPAIAGAIFDATGRHARRLPFRPANIQAILKGDQATASLEPPRHQGSPERRLSSAMRRAREDAGFAD